MYQFTDILSYWRPKAAPMEKISQKSCTLDHTYPVLSPNLNG
ncbi:hypothetical protein VL20_5419 [Microcystis panniformis FACHB-1757]|uniref:Uncharacterized protein n=1 Tax=Microcystis panniformis FACHB-1757 TaxID=1638788 RepID=A0A0K1S7Z9_9CHRO|nr:hypothetical protein VL20_5419 [Microcystis panniformis FACHB-1757]